MGAFYGTMERTTMASTWNAYERETIINFNEAEDTASVYTHNTRLINRLDALCSENQAITCITKVDGRREYLLPKTWVKVVPPRQLSEEQRARMAEIARERFHNKGEEE